MDTIDRGPDDDGATAHAPAGGTEPVRPSTRKHPKGRPYTRDIDWRTIALVGASVAAGTALGAAIAILAAPHSGEHTRLALARELRRRRPWKRSPWDRLGSVLTEAAERRNKRLRRRDGREVLEAR